MTTARAKPSIDRIDSVQVEQVIHIRTCRGKGTDENVYREAQLWYTFEGKLIAEHDPCPDGVGPGPIPTAPSRVFDPTRA